MYIPRGVSPLPVRRGGKVSPGHRSSLIPVSRFQPLARAARSSGFVRCQKKKNNFLLTPLVQSTLPLECVVLLVTEKSVFECFSLYFVIGG